MMDDTGTKNNSAESEGSGGVDPGSDEASVNELTPDTPDNQEQAPNPRSRDRLHGVTLEKMLTQLVDYLGWEDLGYRINIRCFNYDPSITSSLKFLRKTPWARKKVEELYLRYDYPE